MYRTRKMKATPSWVDKNALHGVYVECARITKKTGVKHEVDHIVPLRGQNVSGLHVPWNLRVIPAEDNRKKRNYLFETIAIATNCTVSFT